jgi:hypothetical protein
MEPCAHPERKRHARLRHQPRVTPLWVGDPDGWALVRQKPRPPLVCPEPGCDVELISYENLNNSTIRGSSNSSLPVTPAVTGTLTITVGGRQVPSMNGWSFI